VRARALADISRRPFVTDLNSGDESTLPHFHHT
jgi:hypothetical protein